MMKTPKNEIFRIVPNELAVIDEDVPSSAFVETFIWEAANNEESALGNLYIVGQVFSLRDRKDNARILYKIARLTKDEYYKNSNRDPASSLKLSLKRLNNFLEKNKKLYLSHSLKINLIISVIAGEKIFVAQLGEGAIFAIRGRKLIPIETKKVYMGPVRDGFIDVVRGTMRADDIIILATPQIFKVGKNKIVPLAKNSQIIPFILKNEKEFTNLGLITIRAFPGQPRADRPRAEKTPGVSARPGKPRLTRLRKVGKPALALLVIAAIAIITILALNAQKEIAIKKNEARNIIGEMSVLREQAESLLQLENFGEAERILSQWTKNLKRLRELGVLKQKVDRTEANMNAVAFNIKRYEEVGSREIINLENNTVNFNPVGITQNKNNIVLFNKNTLYTFDTQKKSGNFRVLPDSIPPIKDTDYTDKDGSSPLLLSENSILKYNNETIILITDDKLASAVSFKTYNDNFYILTPDMIWFTEIVPGRTASDTVEEGAVKKLTPWLKTDIFKNAKDFTIDSFIYVLEDRTLYKLLNGQKNIEVEVDEGIEKIFTAPDFKNIYLLNPHEGQVAAMDKFGNITKRITNKNLKGAIGFTVSDNEKTLFFLNEKRVFSIGL